MRSPRDKPSDQADRRLGVQFLLGFAALQIVQLAASEFADSLGPVWTLRVRALAGSGLIVLVGWSVHQLRPRGRRRSTSIFLGVVVGIFAAAFVVPAWSSWDLSWAGLGVVLLLCLLTGLLVCEEFREEDSRRPNHIRRTRGLLVALLLFTLLVLAGLVTVDVVRVSVRRQEAIDSGESSGVKSPDQRRDDDVDVLVTRLRTGRTHGARASAAEAIGRLGRRGRRVLRALEQAGNDPSGLVRIASAVAIYRIAGDSGRALRILDEALKHGTMAVRIEAAQAIGDLGMHSADVESTLCAILGGGERSAPLTPVLHYGDGGIHVEPIMVGWTERSAAAFALGRVARNRDAAVLLVRRLAKSGSELEAEVAREALSRLEER